MEITLEQVLEAIGKNPSLIDGLLKPVLDSESGKKAVSTIVDTEVKAKIGEEISKTHGGYDNDMFTILGERPAEKSDGSKQKSYEKAKELFTELAELRKTKDSLSKDAEVQRLTAALDKAIKEGGGEIIQRNFDAAKEKWDHEKADYEKRISEGQKAVDQAIIKNAIAGATAQIQFNPDVSETLKKLALNTATDQLLKSAKVENEKVVFLDNDGKPVLMQNGYEPADALDVLTGLDIIKEVTLTEAAKGGGAPPVHKAEIRTAKVDGKDSRTLTIPKGSFKTKAQFIEVAEKTLIENGITKTDPDWDRLKTEAYKEHNVSVLPEQ